MRSTGFEAVTGARLGATIAAVLALGACHGPDGESGTTPVLTTGATATGTSGGTPTGQTTLTGRLEVSGPITCAAPQDRAGNEYVKTTYGTDWPKEPDYHTPAWTLATGGRGMVVADFDVDGVLDILVPRDLFPAEFLHGVGDGTFVADNSWFGGVDVMGHNGASAADVDGDGDPDVVLYGLMGNAVQLINEGDHFTVIDRSEWDSGGTPFPCGGTASWADYDGDGDLDLFYGRLGGTDPYTGLEFSCDSRLLNNDGAGNFTPDDAQISANIQSIRVMVAGWYDFDGNGWPDLYAVSDAPPMRNWVMFNDGGVLTEPPSTGLEIVTAGMGLGVGDLNDDGLPDATISGIRELPTLLSQPGLGLWVESSTAMNLYPDTMAGKTIAWSGDIADVDNDGFSDVIYTYGGVFGNALPAAQPDEIYRNLGDGTFAPVGEAWGFHTLDVGRGALSVDLNGDGWLDQVKRELAGVVDVHLATCGDGGWLEFRLHDDDNPNHSGIGATIRVTAGDKVFTRWVEAGSRGYCSGGPPLVHLGLGDIDRVDRIDVHWPTGDDVAYPGVDANQIVDLWRE